MNALETVIQQWRSEDVRLLLPINESVIEKRLGDLGRACSSDVLAVFSLTGGMEDGDSDSHMFSLWSFQKVIAETARYTRPYIPFGDFLIQSHLFCFKYENQERSSVLVDHVNGEEPTLVAESVEEFFTILKSDAAKLGMFAAD
jgi:hypothetical protein